ncbi:MAG: TonB-dependent receptor [Caulobacter sp.]|nr:TonB-dependent receptor [Caulobacter sp.]
MTTSTGVTVHAKSAFSASALAGAAGLSLLAGQAWAETAGVDMAAARATDVAAVDVLAPRGDARSDKLTARVLDTPKTITTIPREVITQTGAVSLQDLMRTVPGITLASGEGGSGAGDRPLIRGVEATNDVFIDGVRDSGVQSRDVFNLEQVDIIKGPGSAYSGRGSTGGSINLVSKTPHAGDASSTGLTLGADQTRRFTADLNRQLTDTVAVRLNVMTHDADVAGRDAVTVSRWGVAPSIALGLGTATQASLSFFTLRSDDVPDYGIPYDTVTRRPVRDRDETFYGLLARDFQINEADIGTLRVTHDFGPDLRLTNVARYGRTTNAYVVTNPDDSRGNVVNGYVFRASKTRNVEVETLANVTTLSGVVEVGGFRNSFAVGAEVSRETSHNQGYYITGPGLPAQPGFAPSTGGAVLINGPGGCSFVGSTGAAYGYNCTTLDNPNPNDPWIGTVSRSLGYKDVVTEVKAIYAFNTVTFSPRWSLNLGLRYDDYRTSLTGVAATATTTAPYYSLAPETPLENRATFFNGQIGLVYKPTPDASLYASVGTSSDPSGQGGGDYSTVSSATDSLKPERSTSYEVGGKWALLEGGLLVSGALFRTEKNNASIRDPLGGENLLVGKQRVDGLEISVSGSVKPGWTVFGGYTFLASEILADGPAATNVGNAFPNTPEHAFTLWTDYQLTPAFDIGGGAVFMGERFGDAANTRLVDSYWRFDAMAAWRVTDRADLRLNLQNLSDERYVLRAYTTHMVQLAPGRSAQLTLNVRF